MQKLITKKKRALQDEQKVIEQGKRLYKIDLDDPDQEEEFKIQEVFHEKKDKLLKKMVIIEDSKASIDKQFTQQH